MRKMKGFAAGVIAAIAVIVCFGITVSAAAGSGTCSETVSWTLDASGVLTISGTGAIPDYTENKAPWYNQNRQIKDIVIQEGITAIGQNAFSNRYNEYEFVLPISLDAAQEVCYDAVVSVHLPRSLRSVGKYAFVDCTNLADVYYAGTQQDWAGVTVATENGPLNQAQKHFHEHSFTNYISNNDATYDADGTKTAKCDGCEATDTQPDPGSRLKENGWVKRNGYWYYYASGAMKTGWVSVGGVWYYMNSAGIMQTGWLYQGGVWYYLRPSGAMATGWCPVGGVYYYFASSGAMKTGWLQEGNTWYYLRSSGAMATGWCAVGGVYYYFASSGAMKTGWLQEGSTWYYLRSSGAMATGWLKEGNTWYYFHSSGAMATGSVKIGNKTYRFNSSGACLNP